MGWIELCCSLKNGGGTCEVAVSGFIKTSCRGMMRLLPDPHVASGTFAELRVRLLSKSRPHAQVAR